MSMKVNISRVEVEGALQGEQKWKPWPSKNSLHLKWVKIACHLRGWCGSKSANYHLVGTSLGVWRLPLWWAKWHLTWAKSSHLRGAKLQAPRGKREWLTSKRVTAIHTKVSIEHLQQGTSTLISNVYRPRMSTVGGGWSFPNSLKWKLLARKREKKRPHSCEKKC